MTKRGRPGKLSDSQRQELRRLYEQGQPLKDLAERFGFAATKTIQNMATALGWERPEGWRPDRWATRRWAPSSDEVDWLRRNWVEGPTLPEMAERLGVSEHQVREAAKGLGLQAREQTQVARALWQIDGGPALALAKANGDPQRLARQLYRASAQPPEAWTGAQIHHRMVEAFIVLARLPAHLGPDRMRGILGTLQLPAQVAPHSEPGDAIQLRRPAPTAVQISRMEQALTWPGRFLACDEPGRRALLVFCHGLARGQPRRAMQAHAGLPRTEFDRARHRAALTVAIELAGAQVPVN